MRIRMLVLLFFWVLSAACVAEDFDWETRLRKDQKAELAEPPNVVIGKEKDGIVSVEVTNNSARLYSFNGYGNSSPQQFIKKKVGDAWKCWEWDWCGTGMSSGKILPKQTVTFRVSIGTGAEQRQIFTVISNDKQAWSFIKLYEGPGKQ